MGFLDIRILCFRYYPIYIWPKLEGLSRTAPKPVLFKKEITWTTYRVRLTGQNFLRDSDLVGKDPWLKDTVLNDVSDPPVITIESVGEVPAMAYDAKNRSNALIFMVIIEIL